MPGVGTVTYRSRETLLHENASLRRQLAERDAEIARIKTPRWHRLELDAKLDDARRDIVLSAVAWFRWGRPLGELRAVVATHEFYVWSNYMDECLGCGAKIGPGAQWCWGVDDQSLCDECFPVWRKEQAEVPESERIHVWGYVATGETRETGT